jgi:hypothetical protein
VSGHTCQGADEQGHRRRARAFPAGPVITAIIVITLAELAAIVVAGVGLAGRRAASRRGQRAAEALAARYREAVLELALTDDGHATLPAPPQRRDRRVVGTLLAETAELVRGESRERISAYVDSHGYVDQVLEELHAPSAWRRGQAAHTLGEFGSRRAVSALTAQLRGDRSPAARAAAARSLGRLGRDRSAPDLIEACASGAVPPGVAAAGLLQLGAPAQPWITAALELPNEAVRLVAARVAGRLGAHGDEEMLSALRVAAVLDDAADVRASACEALGRTGDVGAAVALAGAMRDRSPAVREAACDAAGRMAGHELVRPAAMLTQDAHAGVRRAAARAMLVLGSMPDADEALVREAEAELAWGWA